MTDMLVDGNSLFARSWFAAQRSNPDNPAESLRLGLQTIFLLLNPDSNRIGYNIDRLLFGWDGARKAEKNRDEKPPEYHENKLLFKDILQFLFGCPHAEHRDYEGDDIIATAVFQSTASSVYVVSGDKDLMQLQGGNINYYCLNNKAVLSKSFIVNKWGIKHPNQIAIALAIIGDPVDNIGGVPRWGPKKVQKLFESVPDEMPFDKAVAYIESQIPGELKEAFWSSLDRTLLHSDVPGVPEPAPLQLRPLKEVAGLGLPGIMGFYSNLWNQYMVEPF